MLHRMDGAFVHIERMAVAIAWQGRGIGTAMLDRLKLKQQINNRDAIVAYTTVENSLACEFFSSRGFSVFHVGAGDMIEFRWPCWPWARDVEEIAVEKGWC